MRASLLVGVRRVELTEVDEPQLRPGSVVVEIDRCGVSGSDVEAYVSGLLPAGAWFGHEWVGRVVAVGPEVVEHFEGERVIGAAPPACGACRPCRAGLGDHCALVVDMIVGVDGLASPHGAFAERIRVDARRAHRLPEGIDDVDAAIAEPAAVAVHAIARATVALGDVIVVIGAGTIGLLVAELSRLSGASAVVAIDADPYQRELSCDLGADAAFSDGSGAAKWLSARGHGLGADIAFDCSGSPTSLATAVDVVRRGGTVVAVGVRSTTGSPRSTVLLEREADLRAAVGYTATDVRRALSLMADDRLRVVNLYEPEPIGLGDLDAALHELSGETLGSGIGRRRKLLVAP